MAAPPSTATGLHLHRERSSVAAVLHGVKTVRRSVRITLGPPRRPVGGRDTAGVFLARPGSRGPQVPSVPSPAGCSSIPIPGPLGSTIGFGAGLLTTVAAALLGARDAPALGVMLLAAAAIAAITTLAGAVAAAAQCWAFWDGFLVNGLDRLNADRGGWQGLVLLVAAVAVVYLAAAAVRYLAARRPTRPTGWGSSA